MGLRAKLAAATVGLTVALGVGEVALRTFETRGPVHEIDLYRPDLHCGYRIASRAPSMSRRGPHNALGFRGPEVERPKPPGLFRVVCVGGSTTYGTTDPTDAETWPRRMEQALRSARPRVEVVNAGVPAHNSADSLQLLREVVLPLQPDVVVFLLGYNDVVPRFVPGFRSDFEHFRSTWKHPNDRAAPLAILRLLARRSTAPGGSAVLRTLTARPHDESPAAEDSAFGMSSTGPFARNVRTMIDGTRGAGAHPVLLTQAHTEAFLERDLGRRTPFFRKGMAEHAMALREIAKTQNVLLVDLERSVAARVHFDDCVHLSSAGNQVVARFVAEAVGPILGAATPPQGPR